MSSVDFDLLFEAMPIIDAQEKLDKLQVAVYPNMKEQGRKKLYKEVMKQASKLHKKKTVKMEDAEQIIKGLLNG